MIRIPDNRGPDNRDTTVTGIFGSIDALKSIYFPISIYYNISKAAIFRAL